MYYIGKNVLITPSTSFIPIYYFIPKMITFFAHKNKHSSEFQIKFKNYYYLLIILLLMPLLLYYHH